MIFACIVDVGNALIGNVLHGDFLRADGQDEIVAAGRRRFDGAADLNDVFVLVVGDGVVAVACLVEEDIRAVAAGERVVCRAADYGIVAVAAVNLILARAAVNPIVFFRADDVVGEAVGSYRHGVLNG